MPKLHSVQKIAQYSKDNVHDQPAWLNLFDSLLTVNFKTRTQVAGEQLDGGKRVLDIGAGDCDLLKTYAVSKYDELVAVDFEHNLMRNFEAWAKKNKLKVSTYAGDFLKYKTKKKFDTVCALAYLEHVVSPFEHLKKISSLLNTGGTLIVEVPNVGYLLHRISLLRGNFPVTAELKGCIAGVDDVHIRFYTLQSLTKILNYCGFEVVSATNSGRLAKLRQVHPILWSDLVVKAVKVSSCPKLNPIKSAH